MDIKERFYDNLNVLREGVEKGNQKLVRLENSRAAAKKAIGHVNKHNYEAAHAAVKGTALEKGLHSHLNRAQKHWTEMNKANNEAGKHSTSSKNYDSLRSKANDHQDQAQHHHDNAVEFLKGYMRMDEEVEQLDELRGKGTLSDKDKKELQGRIYKKHGKAWDDTQKKRKALGSKGPSDTRDLDQFRGRLGAMYNKLDK